MHSPPLIRDIDQDVYLVLDNFGLRGRVWREVDEHLTNREAVIRSLGDGHYEDPERIICFNTSTGMARDVTMEIVRDVRDRADREGEERLAFLRAFIDASKD
jgi:hypothetical protein